MPPEPWNPAHTRHDSRALGLPTTTRTSRNGPSKFAPEDRAFLAALLQILPREALLRLRLFVRPDTVLRWHRDLIRRQRADASRSKRPGRPRTVRSTLYRSESHRYS
jgi:hypothetical protein